MHIRYIYLIVIGLLLSGCASEQKDWDVAKINNNSEKYLEYIEKYPDGEHINEVKQRLEIIEYNQASQIGTVEAYRNFLNKYPNSNFTEEAIECIENLEWDSTQKNNSIQAYEKFMQVYPKSKFLENAQRNIMLINYEKTVSANSSELYEEYLKKYPQSEYTKDIEERKSQLSYQNYNSAAVNIGSANYKNAIIKNIILLRIADKKTQSEQGLPIMNSDGGFLIENGTIKTDKSKKAYSISYFAVNGQDIEVIEDNNITILPTRYIYKLEVIDSNSEIDDSFLINAVVSRLRDQSKSFSKETALSLGFCWLGQLENGDSALYARDNYHSSIALSNVGLLVISVHTSHSIKGRILGQLIFDAEECVLDPAIEILEQNVSNFRRINLEEGISN